MACFIRRVLFTAASSGYHFDVTALVQRSWSSGSTDVDTLGEGVILGTVVPNRLISSLTCMYEGVLILVIGGFRILGG